MKTFGWLAVIWMLFGGVYGCSAQLVELKPNSGKTMIAAGTVLKVALIDPISTEKSTPGDHFSGTLAEAVVIDGRTLLEKGTAVRGRIFDLREPRRLNGGAALHLILTEIMVGGKSVAITTKHFEALADLGAATRDNDIHLATMARLDFVLATQIEI
jgi:hypothetical protein